MKKWNIYGRIRFPKTLDDFEGCKELLGTVPAQTEEEAANLAFASGMASRIDYIRIEQQKEENK